MTSIAIADDHEVVRQGLRSLLSTQTDFRFVAEAADGVAAVRMVEQYRPEVLMLDLSLPLLGGLEVALETTKISPRTHILIVSMHNDEAHVSQALRAGALGYVLKDARTDELIEAVRSVAAGRQFLSSRLPEVVMTMLSSHAAEGSFDAYEMLTTRERQILNLAADGLSAAEIGKLLFISPRTVESHRANLMRKLGLRGQTDIVLFAVRRGLLPERG